MYKKLKNLSQSIQLLASIDNLLSWDMETRMPKKGILIRTEQQQYISYLIHKKTTSPLFKKYLAACIDLSSGKILLPKIQKEEEICLREWKKSYQNAKKLPASFVKKLTETTSSAFPIWVESKKNSDFALFRPVLKKIIDLMKKKTDLLGYEKHPYDALLDAYEPGMTTEKLEPLFCSLKSFLVPFISTYKDSKASPWLTEPFCLEGQKRVTQKILQVFPLDKGRLVVDEAEHPFTISLHPRDVRITSRVQENYLLGNIFALLHEGGHALYDTHLPEEHYGTPMGEAISHGIHESQSRLWETFVGKSLPFWHYFYPILQEIFPNPFTRIPISEFYQDIHRITPSCIRIEADEVTYTLHIILRFEIEKALFDGSCSVDDIPDLWNSKMKELFGIIPATDKEGCLQDVHWSAALFGYFPSYALGNLYAAQLYSHFLSKNPSWVSSLEQGNLFPLCDWLKENIHSQGKRYTAEELIEKITLKPLSTQPYETYLREKYSSLKKDKD